MSRSFSPDPHDSCDPSLPPAVPAVPTPVPAAASHSRPALSRPLPLPPSSAPEPRGVPPFGPLRVRGSQQRLRRALLRRRRTTAAGLAMTAAALAATGASGAVGASTGTDGRARPGGDTVTASPPPLSPPSSSSFSSSSSWSSSPPPSAGRSSGGRSGELVSAAVRIADAETVRLLRRGDRVDVIAAAAITPPAGVVDAEPEARVVAAGVRVAAIPKTRDFSPDGGALVVLSVPRATAAVLAAASATSRLAVAVC
ncbi:hypothetical protein [Streptomyces sp. NBC_00872]|uniref:hypothetical protein n=1 Tax=Streptomyces sp. NBC_00872 TaxID=2903686 RepID=UPI003868C65D